MAPCFGYYWGSGFKALIATSKLEHVLIELYAGLGKNKKNRRLLRNIEASILTALDDHAGRNKLPGQLHKSYVVNPGLSF